MEVHFTPEQDALIARIAEDAETDPEGVVRTAVMRLLEERMHLCVPASDFPVKHLGEMSSLHRRDLYDDAG